MNILVARERWITILWYVGVSRHRRRRCVDMRQNWLRINWYSMSLYTCFLRSYDKLCYESILLILCLVYFIENMFVYSVYLDLGFIKSSLEYWSVLCP